jgi:hypothetical protein
MSQETLDLNTLSLLRTVVKCTSAIENADHVVHSPLCKRDVKKLLPPWIEKYEKHVDETVKMLSEVDEAMLTMMINEMSDIDNYVFIKNEDKTNVFLLMAKIESSLFDLAKIEHTIIKDSAFLFYLNGMLIRLNACLNGEFHYMKRLEDDKGKVYPRVVEMFNQLGDELVFIQTKPDGDIRHEETVG